ncbi:MAG: efflux RND transporter periplasmic adaptor subunit [bacterium]|nr:efflux RND transporter periplasmic adaptor subunit [bacterium]
MHKFIVRICFAVVGLALLLILYSCGKSEKSKKPKNPEMVPVTVATVIRKDVPLQRNTIGSVESYSTISVVPQVGGTLFQVKFQEGQEVKKGDLLFIIDPEPYQLALKQAEAELERSIAQHAQTEANYIRDSVQFENAKVELNRAAELLEAGVITQAEYDQTKTNVESLLATLQADRAAIKTSEATINAARSAVENAKIQLGYCYVRSPISGRTGSLLINQGSVVKANDKPVVAINQVNPIYVSFALPEQDLSQLKKYMRLKQLNVEAVIQNEAKHRVPGTLSFLDNAIDRTTGTIRLKAIFPNADHRLWPGQFVDVILTLTTELNMVVVPNEAIQTGPEGQFVYIVKSDNTVELRPIVVRRRYGSESVVEQGVQPGEIVVTDGQLRLTPGAKIEIKK